MAMKLRIRVRQWLGLHEDRNYLKARIDELQNDRDADQRLLLNAIGELKTEIEQSKQPIPAQVMSLDFEGALIKGLNEFKEN
jgi:hypothetical protein